MSSALSPGVDHQFVPRDLVANLKFRIALLEETQKSLDLRLGLVELCRRDVLFFVNVFGWQYNPKRVGEEVGPFVTWPRQEECLLWMVKNVEEQQDGLIEKSREEGASWLALWLEVWLTRFHGYKDCFNVSKNADAVDKSGNKNTLFAKVDFILAHLPSWLGPEYRRVKFLFDFPSNGSQINGEATTDAAGVGGRASFALIDELGKIPDDHAVVDYTADTCDARHFVSTHTGVGTAFHVLCERADRGEVRRFRLHWSHNPRKNVGLYRAGPHGEFQPLDKTFVYAEDFAPVLDGSPTGGPYPGLRSPWYDRECRRRGGNNSSNVKLNLDIDVAGASSQFYDPLLIDALKKGDRPPVWEGDVRFDEDGTPFGLVPQRGGPLQLWFEPGNDSQGRLAHVPPAKYSIGSDPSAGVGATPSCAAIYNADQQQKVGRYTNGFIKPERFGPLLVALARLFRCPEGNPAYLIWETPGVGSIMGRVILHECGFRHVYYAANEFRGQVTQSDNPGWNSSQADSRLDLHTIHLSGLLTKKFVNPSASDLEECKAFVRERGSVVNPKATKTTDPAAGGSNHSDHVIADALSYYGAVKKGWVGEKAVVKEKDKEPIPNSVAGRRLLHSRAAKAGYKPSLWR